MRGVLAPSGTHDIQYRYRPGSFYAGGVMSAAGIVGACCLAFFSRKRRDAIDLDAESRNNQDLKCFLNLNISTSPGSAGAEREGVWRGGCPTVGITSGSVRAVKPRTPAPRL